MQFHLRWAVRAMAAFLAGLLVTIAGLTAVSQHSAAAGRASMTDARIGRADCALLGRRYVVGSGCSRDHCVPGAHRVKGARGAELCGRGRDAYATAVDYRRCGALHRRWIPQVNACASNPYRARSTIRHAPQCSGPATTYVTHTEREGWYDECLRPREVSRLTRLARHEHTSVEHEASVRSATLCSYRPRHVFEDGLCVPGVSSQARQGGVLLVGDSIAWRGTDELGRIRPDFTLDGMPSRRLSELSARLDWFGLDHGDPTGLIVELGTNADHKVGKADLRRILGSLPADTTVMLVLPYRRNPHAPPRIQPSSTHYSAWMRDIASDRAHTCVADWRAEVRRDPRLLVDGVHPTSSAESYWARWVSRSWSRCH